MIEIETQWAALASRVIRVILARRDVSYAQLSNSLTLAGTNETERSLASRVSRGRIKASLLLQILSVTNAKAPILWADAMSMSGSWEDRAGAIVGAELSRHPIVTIEELAQRMVRIGADLTEKTIVAHLTEGTLSLPELLQCLVALGSSSLERYVDYEDLVAAASTSPFAELK
ncbi:hypothetical protein ABH945_003711 [Paraburkholderia sp. GAS333]|uniref:DUF6471 domain-containing protein n=1 Tax=Paraburkholderia sp. GAS333 TaxID=3156279 RepID=UPI003D1B5A86